MNRTPPSLDTSIARMSDVSPDTRCAEVYQEMNLLGGCYPATGDPDVTARTVVSVLEEDGWRREGLLRKDFGIWSATLVREGEGLAFSLGVLTTQSEGFDQELFREGYQLLVNLTLNRDVTQAEAATRTPPGLDTSIARMSDVSPDTHCTEAYQEMNLLGGCYPAAGDPDITTRVVVSVLEEDGWRREGLLRKDFGTWRAVLVRSDEKLAVSVRSLTSQSEGLNQQLFSEGFQSLVNLTLNREENPAR